MSDRKAPVEARLAATVMLLRDSSEGPQVFMMRRHIESDFVGGAYVFPGGRVDPADNEAEDLCEGLDEASASRNLQLENGGLALYVAAIRECFEEAGVLLAYDQEGSLLDFRRPELAARADAERRALNNGDTDFLTIIREQNWRLATDRMHYWAHWITPEGQPKRFDTRFFLATAPPNQAAVHDDKELIHSAWVTPSEALAKGKNREWMIIFPTVRNLMTLLDFETSAEAETAGRKRGAVETLQPRIIKTEGGIQAVLPGDPGYDEAPSTVADYGPGQGQKPPGGSS